MAVHYQNDLHAILGVNEKADPAELRRAYLSLAVKHHPDCNPGDTEAENRFKDISQAYAILSDPVARARYERLQVKNKKTAADRNTGSAGPDKAAAETVSATAQAGKKSNGPASRPFFTGQGSPNHKPGGPEPEPADFDEILSNFFKTDKGRETLRDLKGALDKAGLKFKIEDFNGWMKFRRQPKTPSPLKKSFLKRLAGWLPGAGDRTRRQALKYEISYQLSLTTEAAVGGTSVEIVYQRDDRTHHLMVKIPPGTKDGDRLRLSGQGRLKPDQTRGDLMLTIMVGRSQSVADLWNN